MYAWLFRHRNHSRPLFNIFHTRFEQEGTVTALGLFGSFVFVRDCVFV